MTGTGGRPAGDRAQTLAPAPFTCSRLSRSALYR